MKVADRALRRFEAPEGEAQVLPLVVVEDRQEPRSLPARATWTPRSSGRCRRAVIDAMRRRPSTGWAPRRTSSCRPSSSSTSDIVVRSTPTLSASAAGDSGPCASITARVPNEVRVRRWRSSDRSACSLSAAAARSSRNTVHRSSAATNRRWLWGSGEPLRRRPMHSEAPRPAGSAPDRDSLRELFRKGAHQSGSLLDGHRVEDAWIRVPRAQRAARHHRKHAPSRCAPIRITLAWCAAPRRA